MAASKGFIIVILIIAILGYLGINGYRYFKLKHEGIAWQLGSDVLVFFFTFALLVLM